MECYKDINNNATPVTADISRKVLTLPMYEELTVEDVDKICDVILEKIERVSI